MPSLWPRPHGARAHALMTGLMQGVRLVKPAQKQRLANLAPGFCVAAVSALARIARARSSQPAFVITDCS